MPRQFGIDESVEDSSAILPGERNGVSGEFAKRPVIGGVASRCLCCFRQSRCPARIHCFNNSRSLSGNGVSGGISPLLTFFHSKLAARSCGATATPSWPPRSTPAGVLRFSFPSCLAGPWHFTQCRLKSGAISVSHLGESAADTNAGEQQANMAKNQSLRHAGHYRQSHRGECHWQGLQVALLDLPDP